MIKNFNFKKNRINGLIEIQAFNAPDNRGDFTKDYSEIIFKENSLQHEIKESFYTTSQKGVVRGLHFQREKQQAKLVRCISGHIFDVVVDLRKDSPTFKEWQGFDLTGENHKELLIPCGCAHGFLVLEEAIVSYKCSQIFYKEFDDGIIWNDPDIGVLWPLEKIGGVGNIIISDKDSNLQSFELFFKKYGGF